MTFLPVLCFCTMVGIAQAANNLIITVDDQMVLYIDGVLQNNLPHANDYLTADSVPLPAEDSPLIAVVGINLQGLCGVLASDTAGSVVTDATWKCTNVLYPNWYAVGFDDSAWPAAVPIKSNTAQTAGISQTAQVIWTAKTDFTTGDRTIYCRKGIGGASGNNPSVLTDAQCSVVAAERIECGYGGVTQLECSRRGCCFDSSVANTIWCFKPAPLQAQCAQSPADRSECGFGGITSQQCHLRGCCFDSSIAGTFWCFNPLPSAAQCSSVPAANRAEGGWPGITPAQCHQRGACFDSSVVNSRWCFPSSVSSVGVGLTTYQCATSAAERIGCGYPGVTQLECSRRGCCFDNSVANTIWCFKPAPLQAQCAQSPADRSSCGFAGITSQQCHLRGCCFDSSITGTFWCFNPLPSAAQCSSVPVAKRAEGGWAGITPAQCHQRGCCFDSSVVNSRWCFPSSVASNGSQ